jgi:serpin B
MNRPHLDFALALYRELGSGGNLAWSPYSVASALGLAAEGARGRTLDELTRVLAPGGDLDALGRMLADSARLEDAELAVANSLWMRQDLEFSDTYRQAVLGWPGGALHAADFRADPERARRAVNADVEKTTRGLIENLLAEDALTPDTAAVFVNALYLKVAWAFPFEERATRPLPFHGASGTRDVPTMRQQESMRYAAGGGWRMVTLSTPSDAVVDVLLPDGELTEPDAATLAELYRAGAAAGRTQVDLALPRFRVDGNAVLNAVLGRLGVTAAFSRDDADFSGICPSDRIWIDQVVHQAVLRVDEQGFEGAAATAVVMRTLSFETSEPVPFHVDRPFLVLVRHRRTGAVYFLARVVDP